MSELRFCFFPQDAFELQWMSLPDLALELKCVWWLRSLRHGRISEIQQTAENRATELAHFWKLRVKTRLHKALSKPWLRNRLQHVWLSSVSPISSYLIYERFKYYLSKKAFFTDSVVSSNSARLQAKILYVC